MKPAPFEYARPATLDEALELLGRHGDEAKILAGGQSLVPMMNMRLARPAFVIDINRVSGLGALGDGGGRLRLGALVRQGALERAASVQANAPLLREAAPFIGHIQTRARGTVCGSVAHADPAAELPACFVALDAVYHLASPRGRRTVRAADFQVGLFTTVLEPDELLAEIEVPPPPAPRLGTAFAEVARRHGDFALVGSAAVIGLDDDGVCRVARLVFFAVGDAPVAADVGRLVGGDSVAAVEDAARGGGAALEPHSDLHASAAYRRRVAGSLATCVLTTAWERACR
jgi:aerobic carbon-monoxide dehydrogenase medium subunit